jgi:23S rRNA maturation-related 3'-5' exoribonuclease YhaM
MKTITLQLYTFDELSEEVQKEIIERERWNIMDQCMEAYGSDYVVLIIADTILILNIIIIPFLSVQ